MRRLLPWIAIAGALAAVVVFALPLLTSAPESGAGGAAVDREGTGEAAQEASLVGRGTAGAGAVAMGEVVRGRVVDEQDRPLASVPVELRERTRTGTRERLADLVAEVARPGERGRLLSEAVSDAEGRFALPLPAGAERQLYLDARVEPPRCATQADLYRRDPRFPLPEALVRVLEGTRLDGEVVDATGAGVGAFVEAYVYTAGIGRVAPPPAQTALPSGRFVLGALPKGKASLTVTVPGRVKLRGLEVEMPHEGVFTIRLGGDTGRVAGTVRGDDEEPVAGAQVLLDLDDAERRNVTVLGVTVADGTYGIEAVPAGRITQAQVLATGHLALSERPPLARWSGAAVENGKETRLDLVLASGCVVEGRVTDDATGVPLSGAEVHVAVATTPWDRREAPHGTSDADGRFRVEGVPPGLHLLVARLATHYQPALQGPSTRRVAFGGYGQQVPIAPPELQVLVQPSDRLVQHDLTLRRGGEVRGRVLGPDGEATGGATVVAVSSSMQGSLWQLGYQPPYDTTESARTDAEGRFLLQGLAPGTGRVFVAVAPPLAGIPSEGVDVGPDVKTPEIVLRLQQGATIVGRVVAEDADADALQVYFYGPSTSGLPVQPTHTAADATFRLEGVPPGTVQVSASSWADGRSAQTTVEDLKAGEVREGVELVLARGVRVAGVLVDEEGHPVPRQRIMVRATGGGWSQGAATTDASGAFEIEHAPEGELRATAYDSEGPGEIPLGGGRFTGPVENLRLLLPKLPVGVFEGRILDPAGKPVPLARVRVAGRALDRQVYGGGSLAAEQAVGGTFRRQASGLPPWRVEVSEARGADGEGLNLKPWSQSFETAPEQPIEIRLERGLKLAGRVVGPDGTGVADVALSAPSGATVTDSEGRFSLGGFGEAPVKLTVQVPSGWLEPQPISVAPGEEVVIRLDRALAVAGVLLDEEGHPLANGWVVASWTDDGGRPRNANAQGGSDGRFRLEGLPPGVRVRIQAQTWVPGSATLAPAVVDDVEAGTEDLVVRFTKGVAIEGTVEDENGKPFSACWVQVERADTKDTHTAYAQVHPDGTFGVSGLEPGLYRLRIHRQDGSSSTQEQVVRAPATGVRLVLPPRVGLAGHLEGPGDLGGYHVMIRSGEGGSGGYTTSASDGSFRVDGLAEGTRVTIEAWKEGSDLYGRIEDASAGAANVAVTLAQGLVLAGRLDDADGKEVEGGNLYAGRKGGLGFRRSGVTAGRFRLTGLAPGTWKLRYVPKADEQGERKTLDLGEFEAGRADLDLRLPR